MTLLESLGAVTNAHVHVAAQDYEKLKMILDKEPWLVNAQDANGWTPLHEAALRPSESIVSLLVEMGADLNAVTNHGHAVLRLATEVNRQESMIQLLESLGAELEPEL